MATARVGQIVYGVAALTLPGQSESGDLHLVDVDADGGVLVAVLDGLGHGSEAAVAAQQAVGTIKQYASESLVSLVTRCHASSRQTRGVVLALASFDPRQRSMTWLSVGNICGQLFRRRQHTEEVQVTSLLQRPGVVGKQLPPLAMETVPFWWGDTLILATDGVRPEFAEAVSIDAAEPQRVADNVLARYATQSDDALVLVAQCQE